MTAVPKAPASGKISVSVDGGPEIPLDKVTQLAEEIKKLPSAGMILARLAAADTDEQRAAILEEGKKLLEAEGMMPGEDSQGVDTIRQYADDLDQLKGKEKAAEGVLEDIEKGWPERQEVDRLEDELAKAKEQLKSRRHGSTQYLQQTEIVAKVKRDKAEAKEVLSTYLVWHYRKTGELQVLMDEGNGDARQVVVSARLGGKMKYQTSLDLAPEHS